LTQTIAKQQASRVKRDIVLWLEELERAVSEDYDNIDSRILPYHSKSKLL